MKEESARVTTSLEYTHVGDLSVQLQGTYPKSINGLSPLALIKVVYPDRESEEVLMDLVAKQYYVSHGYTLRLNDVDIGASYLPWRKMFTGTVSLTSISNDQDLVPAEIQSLSPLSSNIQLPSSIPLSIPSLSNIQSSIPPVAVMSPTGIQTMQTLPNYNTERNDMIILAIAALGFVSLGLIGLAILLGRKRGD